ncbi:MAG: hypothetical protein IPJ82_04575 [Lewinellaceae bacterium]|nr:hypothetical protein [Lewinellaceae bacterium]
MFFRKNSAPAIVTGIAAFGLLAGIVMSWPLWNAGMRNTFPCLPIWGGYLLKNPFTGVWPAAFLVFFAFLVLVRPAFHWLTGGLCICLLLLCGIDLNRLQPWVWFYLLVFAVVISGRKVPDFNIAVALRWLLAAVYFWGGFNKLTPYFAEDNFPWFCDAFSWSKPAGQFPQLGYAVALLEMFFAAGLIWNKLRPVFGWIIPVFHGIIVLFLWKLGWNLVVIPWNVAMAAMVWVLRPPRSDLKTEPGLAPRNTVAIPAAIAWFTPLLHFFYLWPHPLSWEMYTNTQPEATFYVESGRLNCTRDMDDMWSALAFDHHTRLLLDDWATKELHVPVFATENTFLRVGNYLDCHVCPPEDRDSSSLFILRVDRWDKSAEQMMEIPGKKLNNR